MPMKVTVCFDKVKVLVPCGDGEILVRDLIEKAITRYKKAQGKANDYWVSVHTLRTVNEDSILDPDDTLCDVVDDREQLVADFEEQGGPRTHHNGGDGQSVSSASPDIFATEITSLKPQHHRGYSFDSNHDVIVTQTDINSGSGLTVRRGSEPALNVLDDDTDTKPAIKQTSKSHGNLIIKNEDDDSSDHGDSHRPVIKGQGQREREKTPPFSRFARDSWRQSLGNQPNMYKWLEAQERQEDRIKQTERQGPVGGATSPEQEVKAAQKLPVKKEVGILICLKNDGTPLGIHVVPHFNEAGRESGLMVQGIEERGRIFQDGRLKVHDRIIEINNFDLHEINFPKAQEIFRNAMKSDEVKLKVVKYSVPPMPKKPPPALLPKPKGHSPTKPSPLTLPPQTFDLDSSQSSPDYTSTPLDKVEQSTDSNSQSKSISSPVKNNGPIKTSSPLKAPSPVGKRAPPAPPTRHPTTSLSTTNGPESANDSTDVKSVHKSNSEGNKSFSETNNGENSVKNSPTPTPTGTLTKKREAIIAPTNTKKIGKRIDLQLVKEREGLGFSVTTRDNTTGGPSPIYIKNILPKGAAVNDGRLKAGDRLLEVNGVEMTGKTQGEAVSVLRNTTLGSTVHISVSRQEVDDEEEEEPQDERFKVPRPLPADKSGDDGTLAVMKNKELMEFDIPLNDTGSAGLGVSVKGKTLTTEEGVRDLGIFVKAVINGGAASKDGRLQVNDQLLEVNDVSLINHANTEAMDLLRNAMQIEGPLPGCINIKVARRVGALSPSPFTSPGSDELDWGMGFTTEKELNNNDSMDNGDNVLNDGRTSPLKANNGDIHSNFKSPNMFLDRIMAGNGLRNQSYTRATHESYVESPEPLGRRRNLIDMSKQRPRPHSTLGIERGSPTDSNSSDDAGREPAWIHGPDWTRHASQTSEESELSPAGDGFSRDGFGRQSMSEKRKGHGDPRSSEIYQKARGLKDLHKNAHYRPPVTRSKSFHTEEVQRTIQHSGSYGRLVRAGSAESLLSRSNSNVNTPRQLVHDRYKPLNIRGPGPPTNLKRFSSLENLSTMPTDPEGDVSASFDDDEGDTSPQPRMARRRGGNESFRAAVDRSYDPVPKLDMDPSEDGEGGTSSRLRRSRSVEEEGSDQGSTGLDPANSARSVTSDASLGGDGKKKGGKKNKDARKSGGGLFNFFKFGGKGRKTPVEEVAGKSGKSINQSQPSRDTVDSREGGANRVGGVNIENVGVASREGPAHREHIEQEEHRWRQAEAEYEKSQEQYRQLQEHLHDQHLPTGQQPFTPFPYKPPEPHSMGHSAPVIGHVDLHRDQPLSRAERIQQLRADHQRKHQERQGHYPHEDREEEYERRIQEDEKKAPRISTGEYFYYQKYGQSAIPSQIDQQGHTHLGQGHPQPGQGHPQPGQDHPQPGQGHPQPGQGHPQPGQGQWSRPSSRNQVERPNSRLGPTEFLQGNSNYQDYRDFQQPGTRHVSDSNMTKYSNFYRPPSRGQSTSTEPGYPSQNSHFVPTGPARGQTPTYDRQPQPRGPTPSFEQDQRNMNFRTNNGNYQLYRGVTPTNTNSGSDHWNYAEDSEMRRGNGNVTRTNMNINRDHVTNRQDVLPPTGGNYGNTAYRDPVYTAMAGKRPVKSLQQPNSAKV